MGRPALSVGCIDIHAFKVRIKMIPHTLMVWHIGIVRIKMISTTLMVWHIDIVPYYDLHPFIVRAHLALCHFYDIMYICANYQCYCIVQTVH